MLFVVLREDREIVYGKGKGCTIEKIASPKQNVVMIEGETNQQTVKHL